MKSTKLLKREIQPPSKTLKHRIMGLRGMRESCESGGGGDGGFVDVVVGSAANISPKIDFQSGMVVGLMRVVPQSWIERMTGWLSVAGMM